MPPNRDHPAAQVLVVDDEPEHAEVMAEALRRMGHVCTVVHDRASAVDELRHGSFDLVVTDLVMDDETAGLDVLKSARQLQTNAETVMVTAHGDVPTAKEALRGGAYDFIEKPLDLEVFRNLCQRAVEKVMLSGRVDDLQKQVDERFGVEGIIGGSPAIQRVHTTIRQVAPADIPVLIVGETGTGKELVARAIRNNSKRARKVFKPVNCAGLSESVLESELFGHVKGAYTDAVKDRQGVFEYADGGTLFLDEIGDMPVAMQAKLLRALESGEVVRVGSNEPKNVDVRFISATNLPLEKLIEEGRFRNDLYYRIRGALIELPPLRERREDIPLLVRHYLSFYAEKAGKPGLSISDEAMNTLMRHSWEGNVRQLMRVVENLVLFAESDSIEQTDLPMEVRQGDDEAMPSGGGTGALTGMSLDQAEKHLIREALRVNKGNREATAKMLGIGERTLYRKLKDYGLK